MAIVDERFCVSSVYYSLQIEPALLNSVSKFESIMKKAIIITGGKQYLVSEGQTLEVELLDPSKKSHSFDALLTIDDNKTVVGTPLVTGVSVKAEVIEQEVKADKVTAIRYKAKKRVHKIHGHRQRHTVIKISKIS